MVFQSFWDDGLLDLLAGLALLLAGLGWQTGLGALAVLQAPLWIALWIPLRRALVEPRAGYVAFSLARRKTNTLGLTAVFLLGVACLAVVLAHLVWLQALPDAPGGAEPVAALPALIVAAGAIAAALLTGAKRFYLYGVLLVALSLITAARAGNPGWPLAGGGGTMVVCGAWLLGLFLRNSRAFAASD